jgi:hypothetical protein
MSTTQVAIVDRAARTVEDLDAEHEEVLIDAARTNSADDFRIAAAYWRSCADDVIGREPAQRNFDRRHLHLSEVLKPSNHATFRLWMIVHRGLLRTPPAGLAW